MAEKWYYVQQGERQGPVSFEEVLQLYRSDTLNQEDYVWSKGFADWKKIKDVSDFTLQESEPETVPDEDSAQDIPVDLDLTQLDPDDRSLFIKTGQDRGGQEVEYGPFSVAMLRKLYDQGRISGVTLIFIQGMSDWSYLAETRGFEDVFEAPPPTIEESERRSNNRRPFVARIFIENNRRVFVGVCRDVSTGGMQVLVNDFPGKVGDTIAINVHPENTDHHFVAAGKIVRILEGNQGFSFRFTDLKPDAINAINNYLQQ